MCLYVKDCYLEMYKGVTYLNILNGIKVYYNNKKSKNIEDIIDLIIFYLSSIPQESAKSEHLLIVLRRWFYTEIYSKLNQEERKIILSFLLEPQLLYDVKK